MENENKNQEKTYRGGFIKIFRYFLDSPVDMATKTIYLVLFSYRFEGTGKCFPAIETVARICLTDRRTVERRMAILEQLGWIKRIKRRGGTNDYIFPLHTTLESQATDMGDASGATTVTHNQEVRNKKYKNKGMKYLFHGRDICFIQDDGSIKIKNGGEIKNYGGGDEGSFRYGLLQGTDAKKSAIIDAQNKKKQMNS